MIIYSSLLSYKGPSYTTYHGILYIVIAHFMFWITYLTKSLWSLTYVGEKLGGNLWTAHPLSIFRRFSHLKQSITLLLTLDNYYFTWEKKQDSKKWWLFQNHTGIDNTGSKSVASPHNSINITICGLLFISLSSLYWPFSALLGTMQLTKLSFFSFCSKIDNFSKYQ